jgi:hypothetical protein
MTVRFLVPLSRRLQSAPRNAAQAEAAHGHQLAVAHHALERFTGRRKILFTLKVSSMLSGKGSG